VQKRYYVTTLRARSINTPLISNQSQKEEA